jgi:bifunctional non-homologous end joining protein LigD
MPVKVLADLRRRLDPLARKLLAEITYLTWTAGNPLRHTVYVGLREDKPAADVRREAAGAR